MTSVSHWVDAAHFNLISLYHNVLGVDGCIDHGDTRETCVGRDGGRKAHADMS